MNSNDKIMIQDYSLASYYVEMFFNDKKLSNATCFFTKRRGRRYLISNWHVVSGKDADTLECLDATSAAIPNKLHIYLPTNENDSCFFDNTFVELDLYNAEDEKVWYELKKNDQMVDIAVIPLENKVEKFILDIEDAEEPFNEDVKLNIADNIYIL